MRADGLCMDWTVVSRKGRGRRLANSVSLDACIPESGKGLTCVGAMMSVRTLQVGSCDHDNELHLPGSRPAVEATPHAWATGATSSNRRQHRDAGERVQVLKRAVQDMQREIAASHFYRQAQLHVHAGLSPHPPGLVRVAPHCAQAPPGPAPDGLAAV